MSPGALFAQQCGDCDGDGVVTVLDALAAMGHEAGLLPVLGMNFVRCNVDGPPGGDGRAGAIVDAVDALVIAMRSASIGADPVCGVLDFDAGTGFPAGAFAGLLAVNDWDDDRDDIFDD